MFNKPSDSLLLLIQSLSKTEKKNFKLYVTRNSRREGLRTVTLFDIMDKMQHYDEEKILHKLGNMPKQQLLNIKARLTNDILSSLRLLRDDTDIEGKMHEMMDFARILYGKGLYVQSLRMLDKLKDFAGSYHQLSYLQQVLAFEKDIEGLHITRSMQGRAEELASAANEVRKQLTIVNGLSNLSLQLYSWYITHGHARNEEDAQQLRTFFDDNFPAGGEQLHGFYQELYYHQSYCWLKFILQDFFKYYKHVNNWVALFDRNPQMKQVEVSHYIKGLHNLATAHFYLRNARRLSETIHDMELFDACDAVRKNEGFGVPSFIYLYTAKINRHFLEGTFSEGLQLVPFIEEQLLRYRLHFDVHRTLIFHYKIACLYFGSGDNEMAIGYLNKIINWKTDLRLDLQCYARLLHLIAHYELGNYDLLEYLSRSVYKMMARMASLSVVEEEVFSFLKQQLRTQQVAGRNALQTLLQKLRSHSGDKFETRAFSYLDITSWLESKLQGVPVQDVIRQKYLGSDKHRVIENV
ncbi:MAG: hypothetical protein QM642_00120 [Edaphocola sp.]